MLDRVGNIRRNSQQQLSECQLKNWTYMVSDYSLLCRLYVSCSYSKSKSLYRDHLMILNGVFLIPRNISQFPAI